MTIKRVSSGTGLPAGFPFSLASESGGVLYISGMPALGPDGSFVPGPFTAQADRAWANVVAVADAVGYGPADILYVQAVLGDIGDYEALDDWWRAQFTEPAAAPARMTFSAGLPFGARVEFQAVASRERVATPRQPPGP